MTREGYLFQFLSRISTSNNRSRVVFRSYTKAVYAMFSTKEPESYVVAEYDLDENLIKDYL